MCGSSVKVCMARWERTGARAYPEAPPARQPPEQNGALPAQKTQSASEALLPNSDELVLQPFPAPIKRKGKAGKRRALIASSKFVSRGQPHDIAFSRWADNGRAFQMSVFQ